MGPSSRSFFKIHWAILVCLVFSRTPGAPAPVLSADLGVARSRALELVRAARYDAVWKLSDSVLSAVPGKPALLFWPWEEDLLAFLSHRWGMLTDSTRWSRPFSTGLTGKRGPDEDGFGDDLIGIFVARRSEIEKALDSSGLEPSQAGFIRLYFMRILSYRLPGDKAPGEGPARDRPDNDAVNRAADRWLRQYPDKPQAAAVRDRMRFVERPARFGYGADLDFGLLLPTGGLAENIDRDKSWGMALELMLWQSSLRFRLENDLGADARHDLRYRGRDWKAGGGYYFQNLEIQAGWDLLNTPSWRIVPYASWGKSEFLNQNLADDSASLAYGESSAERYDWGWGVRIQNLSAARLFAGSEILSCAYAGLAGGMRYPHLEKAIPGLSGSEAYLQMEFGFRSRAWVRDY